MRLEPSAWSLCANQDCWELGLQLRAPVQSSETADCAWKEQRNAFLGFLGSWE
jgi:hypothetical protein